VGHSCERGYFENTCLKALKGIFFPIRAFVFYADFLTFSNVKGIFGLL